MALTLPTSMERIIGDKLLRVATSYDQSRFFLDIPKANPFAGRTRYGYQLTDAVITGSYNLAPLIGATVLDIELTNDGAGEGKLIFTTNPTGSKVEKTILYIGYADSTLSYLLQDTGDYILQDDGFRILIQDGTGIAAATITDTVIAKNAFQSVDSDTKFFVVQEDDF